MREFRRDDRAGRKPPSRFRNSGPKRFGRRESSAPEREDSGRFERRDSRRSFDRRMHTVICAKCGEQCEVPFIPREGKPVYCSNCFRKDDNYESRRAVQSSDELEQINKKLDKIMKALKIY